MPSDETGELVHGLLDDGRGLEVEGVDRLPRLEEHVGVLSGAPDEGALRAETAGAVRHQQLVVDHGAHVVLGQLLNLVDLGAGAEAVEKVDKGHPGLHGSRLCNEGEIHDLLRRVAGQEPPSGGAHSHHIAVVAKDGERLAGEATRGNVKDRGRKLAGDLVHVGNHQEQALGGGKGSRQGAGL